jgi:tetratricopeptide (TPR) repeat protein
MAQDPIPPTPPRDPRLDAVEAAIVNGDMGRATALADRALSDGLIHPLLLNLRALKAETEGRIDDSLADLRRAVALAPEDVSALNALGLCEYRMGLHAEAIDSLSRATRLEPAFAQAWNNLGVSRLAFGDLSGARASFETAAGLQPGFAEPRGHLALMAVRRGDREGARKAAAEALAVKPQLSEAVRALAEADLAEDKPADAEQRLNALLADPALGPNARYLSRGLLGDALDRQGRYPEAFEAYRAANLGQRDANVRQFGSSDLVGRLEALREAFHAGWPRGVEAEPAEEPSPARAHIFLIGFMRSGTTLMEQVLASQPDAVSLEEKEVLVSSVTAFMGRPESILALARADEATLAAHRADYWRRVRAWGVEPAGKVFVDKMPFDGLRLPLIHRLFPEAKIVFSLRDPRDVIFSCFRHRFAVTAYTYELLTLPTAVRFYDAYMKSVEAFDARLPLRMHRYKHEDLVADFDGQVRALCDFLEIEWNETMRDIGARARQGRVTSPSAPQLLGGLSSAGVQQWRRYEAQLAPYLGDLGTWARRFDYA